MFSRVRYCDGEYTEKSHIGRKADEFSFGHAVEGVGLKLFTGLLDIEGLGLWRADACSHEDGEIGEPEIYFGKKVNKSS